MRKVVAVLACALLFVVPVASPAAAQHPNSCAEPVVTPGTNGVTVCSQIGWIAVTTDDGGYILVDGASSNPSPFWGYLVVTFCGGGAAEDENKDWNPGDPTDACIV